LAKDGASVLLLVNVGGVPTAIAEQTGLTATTEREMIEATHKQNDHTKFLYGKRDDTLTLESLYIANDAGMNELRRAYGAKESVILRRSDDGVHVEQAEALITSIEDDWPDNDTSTISVEFQLNEAWTTL